jgi:phage baseplate assembly protein V
MGGELYHDVREHYQTGGVFAYLRNLIRIGTVSNRRNLKLQDGNWGAQVQPTWPDKGDNNGVVGGFLTCIQQGSMGSKRYFLPRAGDQVISIHDPDAPEHGFVIGTLPTTSNPHAQNPSSINSELTTYDDGARREYDPDAKKESFSTPGEIDYSAGTTITITAEGRITITSYTSIIVEAPSISLNGVIIDSRGNVTIPGTLTVEGLCDFQAGGNADPSIINVDGSGGGS